MCKKSSAPMDSIEQRTRALTHDELCDLVLGVKPEIMDGKVQVDGVFPASQFHFRLDHNITPREAKKIREAVSYPFAGLVGYNQGKKMVPAIHIFASRIIITTATPGVDRAAQAKVFCDKINEALA